MIFASAGLNEHARIVGGRLCVLKKGSDALSSAVPGASEMSGVLRFFWRSDRFFKRL